MNRVFRALAILLVVLWTGSAAARSTLEQLVDRLENGADFRVRVQAALELGKRKTSAAREPLEQALGDSNAAVRASAAAALKMLGDPRAIPALKKHLKDSSAAVRSQIKSTIEALEKKNAKKTTSKPSGAKILIEVGQMSNGTTGSKTLVWHFEQTSRSKLGEIPGVEVLEDGVDSKAQSTKRRLPVVKVTGKLRKLVRSKEGSEVVYSAKVEFVVHKMPGNAIKGTVSGTARASTSAAGARNKRKLAQLRREAIAAAVSSALRRAPEAIRAAAF